MHLNSSCSFIIFIYLHRSHMVAGSMKLPVNFVPMIQLLVPLNI
jgi:hypothetical protein